MRALRSAARRAPSSSLSRLKQVVARNLGLGDFRLRAVAAVLRAEAALGVHQEIELHLVAEPAAADAIGGGQQVEQLVIGALQHGQRLVAA